MTTAPMAASTATARTRSVRLRGLTKVFAGTTVVDDLDLDVASGEFFSLLGPSGCGKTTTLRMIAGFNDPTSGSVLVGGEDVTGTPRTSATSTPSSRATPSSSTSTSGATSASACAARASTGPTIDQRVSEMLELVELGDRAEDRPARLSGGQRQRVALARALINGPRCCCSTSRWPRSTSSCGTPMQAELKSIQREVGITFLFVTHDQDEALSMSDRVAIMNEGVIEQCGTPEDVYEHPTSVSPPASSAPAT